MSESILDLGSALVVHSSYAEKYARTHFRGPILKLGMPCDQKAPSDVEASETGMRAVKSKQAFTVVSFGHVQPTKCIHLALGAIASSDVLRRKLRYTICGYVGDHEYFETLKDYVAAEGLDEVVRFETNVSDGRLSEIMRDADIFINLRSPNTEGSSASLIEQLDSGRPVIVFDSGCYAEVPEEAAIKLPVQAGSDEIRTALEHLIVDPKRMPAVGLAGQSYARRWTCASYGERFVTFVLDHRDLLRRRGACVGITDGSQAPVEPQDEAWIARLAQARSAMRYLDRNVLMIDPELLLRLQPDELCSYVAHVIFGIFDDARLRRSLMRFFVCREGGAAYWACVKFALVVEGIMASSEDAQERLKAIGACYEIDYWEVIESLTFDQYVKTASLMFLGRMPRHDELAFAAGSSASEVFTKRQALLHILQQVSSSDQVQAAKLAHWLEQPPLNEQDAELPCIERELNCIVGAADFREHADLSGFYPQESDHAWTRGARGFIGLRFGPSVRKVEVLVRAVNASADQPAILKLSSGTAATETESRDGTHHLLALDIPAHLTRSDATIWLQLSTSHAGAPADHPLDTRVLGVCLMSLKVSVEACTASRIQKAPLQT